MKNYWLVIVMLFAVNVQADTDCSVVTEISQIECEALLTFYDSTDGSNWGYNYGWNITNTPCDWIGVDCSDGHVTELFLYGKKLSGSIPPEIGNLTQLTSLYLFNNNLSGSIPPEIGNLTQLTLFNLEYNQLSGSIPPEIGNLTQLTRFNLGYNQLSGSIPLEIGKLTQLKSFGLNNNNINNLNCSVVTEIPQIECEALLAFYDSTDGSNWDYDWGHDSNYGWNITNKPCLWIGVTCKAGHITELFLYGTKLSGSIPPEIGNLTQLTSLSLM
ncbi:hypothetical protein QUF74_19890 [Candidatus Halobeggiatoa sp. HSG11]|nr:hypothetical protein [Candidatus Halobeggiatoa sp. HSG11]